MELRFLYCGLVGLCVEIFFLFSFLFSDTRSLFETKQAAPHPSYPHPSQSLAGWLWSQSVWKRTRNRRSGQCWRCLRSPTNKHTDWSQMVKVLFHRVLCGLTISINIFSLCICLGQHLHGVQGSSLGFLWLSRWLHSKAKFVWSASIPSNVCHLY